MDFKVCIIHLFKLLCFPSSKTFYTETKYKTLLTMKYFKFTKQKVYVNLIFSTQSDKTDLLKY